MNWHLKTYKTERAAHGGMAERCCSELTPQQLALRRTLACRAPRGERMSAALNLLTLLVGRPNDMQRNSALTRRDLRH